MSFKKKDILRSFARAVSFVFIFTNIAFAHKPQETLWKERRQTQPVQLAVLIPAAPVIPAKAGIQSLNFLPKNVDSRLRRSGMTANLTADLPEAFLAHVNIKDVRRVAGASTVVLIEDVHSNLEAQTHISNAIQALGDVVVPAKAGTQALNRKFETWAPASAGATVLVGLEGASGGFLYDVYQKFPRRDIAEKIANDYLNAGEISGPAHAGFTSYPGEGARGLHFWGVDDPALYRRNVAAYKNSSRIKDRIQSKIASLKKDLENRKAKLFNPALQKFDALVEAHRQGALPFADYVSRLTTVGAQPATVVSFNIEQFLAAYEMEKKMDFKRVEAERSIVLEKLVKAMGEGDLNNLMAVSLAYQEGAVTFAQYYDHLRGLCRKHGLDLAQKTPAFDNYIRYVLLADGVNGEKLFEEISELEAETYESLAKDAEEKALIAAARQLYLAGQLSEFALTTHQWEAYQQGRPLLAGILDMRTFEDFYAAADARNEKMVENLLASSPRKRGSSAVLVAGGFHTRGLTELLNKKGLSYVVATPKLTQVDAESATHYLSVFDREKTPLEQIFSGSKLFLTRPVAGNANSTIISALASNPLPEMAIEVLGQTTQADSRAVAAATENMAAKVISEATGTPIKKVQSLIAAGIRGDDGEISLSKVRWQPLKESVTRGLLIGTVGLASLLVGSFLSSLPSISGSLDLFIPVFVATAVGSYAVFVSFVRRHMTAIVVRNEGGSYKQKDFTNTPVSELEALYKDVVRSSRFHLLFPAIAYGFLLAHFTPPVILAGGIQEGLYLFAALSAGLVVVLIIAHYVMNRLVRAQSVIVEQAQGTGASAQAATGKTPPVRKVFTVGDWVAALAQSRPLSIGTDLALEKIDPTQPLPEFLGSYFVTGLITPWQMEELLGKEAAGKLEALRRESSKALTDWDAWKNIRGKLDLLAAKIENELPVPSEKSAEPSQRDTDPALGPAETKAEMRQKDDPWIIYSLPYEVEGGIRDLKDALRALKESIQSEELRALYERAWRNLKTFLHRSEVEFDEGDEIPAEILAKAREIRGDRSKPLTYEMFWKIADVFDPVYPRRLNLLWRIVAGADAYYRVAKTGHRRSVKTAAGVYLSRRSISKQGPIWKFFPPNFAARIAENTSFWKNAADWALVEAIYKALPSPDDERLKRHLLYLLNEIIAPPREAADSTNQPTVAAAAARPSYSELDLFELLLAQPEGVPADALEQELDRIASLLPLDRVVLLQDVDKTDTYNLYHKVGQVSDPAVRARLAQKAAALGIAAPASLIPAAPPVDKGEKGGIFTLRRARPGEFDPAKHDALDLSEYSVVTVLDLKPAAGVSVPILADTALAYLESAKLNGKIIDYRITPYAQEVQIQINTDSSGLDQNSLLQGLGSTISKSEPNIRVTQLPYIERGADPFVVAKAVGGGFGFFNRALYNLFFHSDRTSGRRIEGTGFLAVVERLSDIKAGKQDRTVYVFGEKPKDNDPIVFIRPNSDQPMIIDKDRIGSVDEMMVLVTDASEWVMSTVYASVGRFRAIDPKTKKTSRYEPVAVVTADHSAKDGFSGEANSSLIVRSQSGGPAVGEDQEALSYPYFGVGGKEGGYHQALLPSTIRQAGEGSPEGTVRVAAYAYQSYDNGRIPANDVVDMFSQRPDETLYLQERALALAEQFNSMGEFQPRLTAHEAEHRAHTLAEEISGLFSEVPSGEDAFVSRANEASGGRTFSDIKADAGGKVGHTTPPSDYEPVGRINIEQAAQQGVITAGSVESVGDDLHLNMIHTKGIDAKEIHSLAWKTFMRMGWMAKVLGYKWYGLMQDFPNMRGRDIGADAKLDPAFLESLRKLPTLTAIQWATLVAAFEKKAEVKGDSPFSGNVQGQGPGLAELPLPSQGSVRVAKLAMDKAGPAAFNIPIFRAVEAAMAADRLAKGAVFEIWDVEKHKRIFLDFDTQKDLIQGLLAATNKYNVKRVWEKSDRAQWDSKRPLDYLGTRILLSASTEKLAVITGGEYLGKDDPVLLAVEELGVYLFDFARDRVYLTQGDERGSNYMNPDPAGLEAAVATTRSRGVQIGLWYTIGADNKIVERQDVFASRDFDAARQRSDEFNRALWTGNGQWTPIGVGRNDVESAYPLAKTYDKITAPDSPYAVETFNNLHLNTGIASLGEHYQAFVRKLRSAVRSLVRAARDQAAFDAKVAEKKKALKANEAKLSVALVYKMNLGSVLSGAPSAIPADLIDDLNSILSQMKLGGRIKDYRVKTAGADLLILITTHGLGVNTPEARAPMHYAIADLLTNAMSKNLVNPEIAIKMNDVDGWLSKMNTRIAQEPFDERGAEPFVLATAANAGLGFFNRPLFNLFFHTDRTSGRRIEGTGFMAVVQRLEDIRMGKKDRDVFVFGVKPDDLDEPLVLRRPNLSEPMVVDPRKLGTVDDMMALVTDHSEWVMTEIYATKGRFSQGSSGSEPVATVGGDLLLVRSQSGAPAIGEIQEGLSYPFVAPGGENGGRHVVAFPTTWESLNRIFSRDRALAPVAAFMWQSFNKGEIPSDNDVVDMFAQKTHETRYLQYNADVMAATLDSMGDFQPVLTAREAEDRAEHTAEQLADRFEHTPSDLKEDTLVVAANQASSGRTYTVIKADAGGKVGHTTPPSDFASVAKISLGEAEEENLIASGSNHAAGDDVHLDMVHGKGIDHEVVHGLAWRTFMRMGWMAKVLGYKWYGLMQDFPNMRGHDITPDAGLTARFADRLLGLPFLTGAMRDLLRLAFEKGASVKGESPFSGNVQGQGPGMAELPLPPTGRVRVAKLAMDKAGPAAFNVPIFEAVDTAFRLGRLAKGAIFEIWDVEKHSRLFLDFQTDRDKIQRLLSAPNVFNVKRVWERKDADQWDPQQPKAFIGTRILLAASTEKLAVITGGEYLGKDDPVLLAVEEIGVELFHFARTRLYLTQGDERGSNYMHPTPVSLNHSVATIRSRGMAIGLWVEIDENNKMTPTDEFASPDYDPIRRQSQWFNRTLWTMQGQWTPIGVGEHDVEAAYPLKKTVEKITAKNSPYRPLETGSVSFNRSLANRLWLAALPFFLAAIVFVFAYHADGVLRWGLIVLGLIPTYALLHFLRQAYQVNDAVWFAGTEDARGLLIYQDPRFEQTREFSAEFKAENPGVGARAIDGEVFINSNLVFGMPESAHTSVLREEWRHIVYGRGEIITNTVIPVLEKLRILPPIEQVWAEHQKARPAANPASSAEPVAQTAAPAPAQLDELSPAKTTREETVDPAFVQKIVQAEQLLLEGKKKELVFLLAPDVGPVFGRRSAADIRAQLLHHVNTVSIPSRQENAAARFNAIAFLVKAAEILATRPDMALASLPAALERAEEIAGANVTIVDVDEMSDLSKVSEAMVKAKSLVVCVRHTSDDADDEDIELAVAAEAKLQKGEIPWAVSIAVDQNGDGRLDIGTEVLEQVSKDIPAVGEVLKGQGRIRLVTESQGVYTAADASLLRILEIVGRIGNLWVIFAPGHVDSILKAAELAEQAA